MSRLTPLLGLLFAATTSASALEVSGDLQTWHKVTISVEGPFAREMDTAPNPFTDYRMTARFEHESGSPVYEVPGYFAADGEAARSGASEGNIWKAHLSPDKPDAMSFHSSPTMREATATTSGPSPSMEKSGTTTAASSTSGESSSTTPPRGGSTSISSCRKPKMTI